MSEQYSADNQQNSSFDSDEWRQDDERYPTPDTKIYPKESINPAKRRRLEAMREEQELLRDIKDVFDEYDFDD